MRHDIFISTTIEGVEKIKDTIKILGYEKYFEHRSGRSQFASDVAPPERFHGKITSKIKDYNKFGINCRVLEAVCENLKLSNIPIEYKFVSRIDCNDLVTNVKLIKHILNKYQNLDIEIYEWSGSSISIDRKHKLYRGEQPLAIISYYEIIKKAKSIACSEGIDILSSNSKAIATQDGKELYKVESYSQIESVLQVFKWLLDNEYISIQDKENLNTLEKSPIIRYMVGLEVENITPDGSYYTYHAIQDIDAKSQSEALKLYNMKNECSYFYGAIIGYHGVRTVFDDPSPSVTT
jgi:hypothetical protein